MQASAMQGYPVEHETQPYTKHSVHAHRKPAFFSKHLCTTSTRAASFATEVQTEIARKDIGHAQDGGTAPTEGATTRFVVR